MLPVEKPLRLALKSNAAYSCISFLFEGLWALNQLMIFFIIIATSPYPRPIHSVQMLIAFESTSAIPPLRIPAMIRASATTARVSLTPMAIFEFERVLLSVFGQKLPLDSASAALT